MNLTEIRRALAVRLDTIPDIHGSAFVPDSIVTLTACVLPGDPYVTYSQEFGGGSEDVQLDVLILCPKNVDFDWQETLDDLITTGTARSLVDAIEDDITLAGEVFGLKVEQASQWGTTEVNQIPCGSVRLRVSVLA